MFLRNRVHIPLGAGDDKAASILLFIILSSYSISYWWLCQARCLLPHPIQFTQYTGTEGLPRTWHGAGYWDPKSNSQHSCVPHHRDHILQVPRLPLRVDAATTMPKTGFKALQLDCKCRKERAEIFIRASPPLSPACVRTPP